jgi:hypothetical protein
MGLAARFAANLPFGILRFLPSWQRAENNGQKKTGTIMKIQIVETLGMTAIMLTTGCASIVSHSNWPITFNSNPSGADLVITDKHGREIQRGMTPTTLTLPSSSGFFSPARYDVQVKLAGYNPATGSVSAELNGWYLGNIVFGGLIGLLIVDPATGAMYRLPEQYTVNLTKTTAAAPAERALHIVSISDVPAELKAKLIRLN